MTPYQMWFMRGMVDAALDRESPFNKDQPTEQSAWFDGYMEYHHPSAE